MEEYVSPSMVMLSSTSSMVSEAGVAIVGVVALAIAAVWGWY